MSRPSAPAGEHTPGPWRFIPLADYARPHGPTTATVRRELRSIFRGFFGRPEQPEPFSGPEKLYPPPARLTEAVSPALRPDLAAEDLLPTCAVVMEHPSDNVLVADPPGGAGIAALALAARRCRMPIIAPPTPEAVLTGGGEWLSRLARYREGPVCIPRLERLFLRHADGLTLLRRLGELLAAGDRTFFCGCGTFAWAYLRRVLDMGALFPGPLTLAPFDGQALGRWFASAPPLTGHVTVRQADTGAPVLPDDDAPDAPASDFLKNLAFYVWGQPGAALAFWRRNILFGADPLALRHPHSDPDPTERPLWVRPFAETTAPEMPEPNRRDTVFVVSALLVHGGLPQDRLGRVLPLMADAIPGVLSRLRRAGVIAATAGRWRVLPVALPSCRRLLAEQGYLADDV
ncbi:hypothetical protein DesfrDRAFT_3154 [Solidesulfovibrio fructosivorans JJ]]|uniref:Uncharacterized protein n=1 Tax=Solidesulfovibrio fructosivorans JJ] TaxID=596151 RepID=E1JZV4_SOLFR|nr:hypothetical protein [Solidesulfovibrio fructosivorans]EFL50134.1 hypothetical protein DesfrDRAFT_3154 [Solidesulfovibrio fructosivorans JJ]]